jgi:hypothetical protein
MCIPGTVLDGMTKEVFLARRKSGGRGDHGGKEWRFARRAPMRQFE